MWQQAIGEGGQEGQGKGQGQADNDLVGDVSQTMEDIIEKHYQEEMGNGDMSKEEAQTDINERIQNAKERMRDAVYKAAKEQEKSTGKGSLPAWMQTELEGILHPKLSIDKLLKKFFGRHGRRTHPTFKKRHRRNSFEANTIVRPGLIQKAPDLWVLLDTSGSMWDKEGFDVVRGTLGMIQKLARSSACNVRMVMCDTEVHSDISHEEVMNALASKNLKLLGGGGSNFIPAFEYIWEKAKKETLFQAPILCITDGYINVPDAQPKMPTETAWVTPVGVEPPTTSWGRHYEMKFD